MKARINRELIDKPAEPINNRTKQVNKVVLQGSVLNTFIHIEIYKRLRENLNTKYKEIESKFFNENWIKFSCGSEQGYWNKQTSLAIRIQEVYNYWNENYFGYKCIKLDKGTVKKMFNETCPSEIMSGIISSNSYYGCHYISIDNGFYIIEHNNFDENSYYSRHSINVGVINISANEFKKSILSQKFRILENDVFRKAVELLKERSILETDDKEKCISEQEVDRLITILDIDRESIEKTVLVNNTFTIPHDEIDYYTNSLLACDKIRADLDVYDKKCLDDVNAGHWKLWSDKEITAEKGSKIGELEKPLIARNPAIDIHEDGLIGIDFGTKSTIVSKRDGREKTDLLRVGTGQLNKKAQSNHYENPTIMEFINLNHFISDYNTRYGRPETKIDDLRVSHTADNDFKACTISDNFYSFFYDIKQWCGDTERNIKIVDQQGTEQILPAFTSLAPDDFNPLEIYAYYLGLYINNMRNGIYLDYVLSFPVTYEKKVKEKILESFTRGLKQSLPETILKNESIMSKFRVRQGVSEPAAYAITALQGYGFEPEENENILYSIFDFGGGTTDFDFGLWRCADEGKREERRYDYVIEHFGSEGDKYLGGENLLELLAFEIFKANADLLGKKKAKNGDEETAGFSFSKPKECDAFPGSETLISNSQEARRNTKQLMEVLRPFWEGVIAVDDKRNDDQTQENDTVSYHGYIFKNTEDHKFPISDGFVEVDLFDKEGNRRAKQKLYIEKEDQNINVDLIGILEKRIEKGISNFFTSIIKAFRNKSAVKSKVNDIQIFLAGNSSKSPILRKLFDERISNEKNGESYYHLFPPLGTADAYAIQQERGITVNTNDITAPTGKTGVAYGLIAGRDGGKIKVISEIKADEQTKFRYNIGIEKRGKFKMVLDRTLVKYGQWVCLIDAGAEDFEIYYTSQPNAANMSISEPGIYNKRCRLPYTDDEADVYIRCMEDSPDDIEYCISKDEPSDNAKVIQSIHLGE